MRRSAMLVAAAVVGATFSVTPAAAGGGCHVDGEPTAGRGHQAVTVVIDECMYTPTTLYVEPGTEVTWINKDPVPHTVSGASLSWGTHETIGRLGRVTHAFKNEGVFPYYCWLHPAMVGAVVVGDPAASKAAASPIETDVEMLEPEAQVGTESEMLRPEGQAETASELRAAAASLPVSSTEPTGAPWLLLLVIAALGVAAGTAVRRTKRGRRSGPEL